MHKTIIMKLKIFLILFIVTLLGTSCNEFLEENPENFISPVNFFNDESEATIALTGVYDILGTTRNWGIYAVNLLIADQGTSVVGTRQTNVNQGGIGLYIYDSNHKVVVNIWQNSYVGIGRANMFINQVEQMGEDILAPEIKNRMKAEALFIRSLLYCNLVRLYGEVPLVVEETVSMDDLNVSRTPIEQIYAQLINDLEFAENNLWYKTGSALGTAYMAGDNGRATVGAARTLLAKIYLDLASYKKFGQNPGYDWVNADEMYQDAVSYCEKVIDMAEAGGNIGLLDNYSKVFTEEHHKESIFEVQFIDQNDEEGGLVAVWGGPINANKYALDRGFTRFGPQPEFTDSYAKTWTEDLLLDESNSDPRYSWNIGTFKYNKNGGKENWNNALHYCCRKYRKTIQHEFLDGTNYRVFRYADVLLMYAEALNELGANPEQAVWAVNQIKTRARKGGDTEHWGVLPESTEPADLSAGLSQEELRQAIRDERGWEMCFEGQARFDDLRWGTLMEEVKALKLYSNNTKATGADKAIKFFVDGRNKGGKPKGDPSKPANNIQDKHWLFPIPQIERDLNANLGQNNGW